MGTANGRPPVPACLLAAREPAAVASAFVAGSACGRVHQRPVHRRRHAEMDGEEARSSVQRTPPGTVSPRTLMKVFGESHGSRRGLRFCSRVGAAPSTPGGRRRTTTLLVRRGAAFHLATTEPRSALNEAGPHLSGLSHRRLVFIISRPGRIPSHHGQRPGWEAQRMWPAETARRRLVTDSRGGGGPPGRGFCAEKTTGRRDTRGTTLAPGRPREAVHAGASQAPVAGRAPADELLRNAARVLPRVVAERRRRFSLPTRVT